MNTDEFMKAVAERSGLTVKLAGEAVRAVQSVLKENLYERPDMSIVIKGFGTFKMVKQPARITNGLLTGGREVHTPACLKPKFKFSKKFGEPIKI